MRSPMSTESVSVSPSESVTVRVAVILPASDCWIGIRRLVDGVVIRGVAAVVVAFVVVVHVVVLDRQILGDADPAIIVDVNGERCHAVGAAHAADDDAVLVVEQDGLAFGCVQAGIGPGRCDR